MWARSKNSEAKKPEKVEKSGSQVIIRKDFLFVQATEEENAHWEYSEWQMSEKEYEIYKNFEDRMKEQEDALVELAGMIAEGE